MRGRFPVSVGLITLAVASGCGATASIGSPSGSNSHAGTLDGFVVFLKPHAHGSVGVFSATGRLVALRAVSYASGQRNPRYPQARFDDFRVVLKPGRYVVELQLESGTWPGCPYKKTGRVRANRTTNVDLSEGCANSY